MQLHSILISPNTYNCIVFSIQLMLPYLEIYVCKYTLDKLCYLPFNHRVSEHSPSKGRRLFVHSRGAYRDDARRWSAKISEHAIYWAAPSRKRRGCVSKRDYNSDGVSTVYDFATLSPRPPSPSVAPASRRPRARGL